MKYIKKCPVFILLFSTGILFSIIGILGKDNIYAQQEYQPFKAPILSIMFTGINDHIYPWEIFTEVSRQAMAQETVQEKAPVADHEEAAGNFLEEENTQNTVSGGNALENSVLEDENAVPTPDAEELPEEEENHREEVNQEEVNREDMDSGRLEPLRESTYEEYLNHISADIYGDAGVLRAAGYEFLAVDESYFDDALFIGDSRTVGLRDYTDLSEHGDFYCETSLTVYKVFEENFGGKGTIQEALENRDYGKIYLMVGINELGRGTTEDFMAEYTKVVDTLHELEPEAKIFIQGVMRVSAKKDGSDAIFNNSNINARNHAIATLADNQQFFYIDVNEVVCDEAGNLIADYTFDQIHLLGVYNDLWKQFLLAHGV